MKRIIKLIIILSALTQICNAQKVETVKEYQVFYDRIVPHLKLAEKKSDGCVGKPFSEFVKLLNKQDVKIIRVGQEYDSRRLYPKDIFGLILYFTTWEDSGFAEAHDLYDPMVIIYFTESKPYEEGLSLTKKYKAYFTEEEFYSDVVIKSIEFAGLDTMYRSTYKNENGDDDEQ